MLNIVHRTGIDNTFFCNMPVIPVHSLQERSPIFLFRLCPRYFRHRCQTREQKIIHIFRFIAEFRPHRTLYPHQQWSIFRFPVFLYRFIVIYIFQCIIAEICQRFEPLRPLITNQIHDTCRSHNETVSLFRSFQCSLAISLPTKNNRAFRQETTVSQFIPTNHFTTFTTYIVTYPLHKIALKVFFISQAFFLHTSLTQRTFFPMCLLSFIASDMDITGRE